MIFSSRNAHIIIASAWTGSLGITKIQLINSTTERRYMNICENVTLPTLQQVMTATIGIRRRKGIIQKTKNCLGRI